MNKMRIVGRIVAGALASAVLLTGALAAPAQAKDTGWPKSAPEDSTVSQLKDTGWPK
ncbi:MAG TPA: hypothetical protein VFZ64_03055 [Nocardioidaceae bacterium]